MNKESRPPRTALNFLLRFMEPEERENFEEYVASVYRELLLKKGQRTARLWFWSQFIRSLPRLVIKSIEGDVVMLKNYVKITLRHIKRHRGYSFINISGLAIGMTCCILILLYIQYELSYDKFHEDAHDIYRIAFEIPDRLDMNASSFGLLAPALVQDFPEVQSAARIRRLESTVFYKNQAFTEKNFFLADPEFFDVFTFPVISG
ncbi:MAG: ABC transporter permease, partial [Candidatus Aminicenantes bacterium]